MLPWSLKLSSTIALLGVAMHCPAQTTPPPPPQGPAKARISPLATAPDWKQLEALNGVLTEQEFQQAVSGIYTDGSNFPVPWRIEGGAVFIETTPGLAPARIAFRDSVKSMAGMQRYWRAPSELPRLQPHEPVLKGLHIALDPGHIGGSWAKVEERWLSMNPGEAVMEGSLVLQVAQLLKPRLEALGARVSMVRASEGPVTKSLPDGFRTLAREVLHDAGIARPEENYTDPHAESRIITVQWQAEKLFYRISEIRARAERVNQELRPDLVLCLHLNAEAWGDPRHPSFVDRNHFHLLINGCYGPDELQFEDVRFEMLRRLFGRVHVQELAMADVVAAAMMNATGLPPYVYINRSARRVSANPAVFSRNLLANRLYQCPVLYFEPYVMNQEQTYKRLLLGHYIGRTLLDGRLVTSPLEDYTRGVERGLVEYYKKARQAD